MARKKTEPRPPDRSAAMQIETLQIADLTSDPANARKHDGSNIQAIADSLRRFGQVKPIVIDAAGVVRAGNGTLEAAKVLGWEAIQCRRVELKGAEATAYAIADNRTTDMSEFDDQKLAAQLQSLLSEDESLLTAAGYDQEQLADMFADNNSEPAAPKKPKMEISAELHERQDYLVITFDNEFDWLVACERLGIKTVESAQIETSTIKKTGIGRVITSQKFLGAING